MIAYRTLNDATHCPELAPGTTEIWYMRPEWFRDGICGERPDPADIGRTHIRLGSVSGQDLDRLWVVLQGEFWSPGGEARELIRRTGLRHTSMSVGDVIVREEHGELIAHVVAGVGFSRLGIREEGK